MRHYLSVSRMGRCMKLPMRIRLLLCKSAAAALDSCGVDTPCAVAIHYAGERGMRRLNSRHRLADRVTDVLSFPQLELRPFESPASGGLSPGEPAVFLGDIVLCPGRALEQAREYGHSLERECAYLTVHSALHLLGFDHDTEENDGLMRRTAGQAMDILKIYD